MPGTSSSAPNSLLVASTNATVIDLTLDSRPSSPVNIHKRRQEDFEIVNNEDQEDLKIRDKPKTKSRKSDDSVCRTDNVSVISDRLHQEGSKSVAENISESSFQDNSASQPDETLPMELEDEIELRIVEQHRGDSNTPCEHLQSEDDLEVHTEGFESRGESIHEDHSNQGSVELVANDTLPIEQETINEIEFIPATSPQDLQQQFLSIMYRFRSISPDSMVRCFNDAILANCNNTQFRGCHVCKNVNPQALLVSKPCEHLTMCQGCFDKEGMKGKLLRYRLAEEDEIGYDCPCCNLKVHWMESSVTTR